MGKSQRDKGQRGELLLRDVLRSHGWTECERGQQRAGGGDSPDVRYGPKGVHFESKFAEQHRPWAAMTQATAECAPGEVPVVAMKRSRDDWLAVLTLEDFLRMVRELEQWRANWKMHEPKTDRARRDGDGGGGRPTQARNRMNIIDWIKGKGGETVTVHDGPKEPEKPKEPDNPIPILTTTDRVVVKDAAREHTFIASRGSDTLRWGTERRLISRYGIDYSSEIPVELTREQVRVIAPLLQSWADGNDLCQVACTKEPTP